MFNAAKTKGNGGRRLLTIGGLAARSSEGQVELKKKGGSKKYPITRNVGGERLVWVGRKAWKRTKGSWDKL